MRKFCIALTATSLIGLFAAPAHALRPNTYVASYGADSGTCSYTAPCRTFTYALGQVQAGGVVTALDSAGNTPFIISKSVTIAAAAGASPSIQAVPNGIAIVVEALASDTVILRGLTLEGENSANAGIYLRSAAQLEIYNCIVHAFIQEGIYVAPTAPASIVISATTVSGMTAPNATGILLSGFDGGSITAALDHVTSSNNQFGIGVTASATSVEAAINDSSVDNDQVGIYVAGCGNGGNGTANAILSGVSLNQSPNPIVVDRCSNTWMSRVVQTLTSPLAYNPGVIFNTHQDVHVFSDGTNMTSAPPNSFEVWGRQ
jgi:hypothetical protein